MMGDDDLCPFCHARIDRCNCPMSSMWAVTMSGKTKTTLTEMGPMSKAPSEPCGCDKRGRRIFLCTYHQGVEDERARVVEILEGVIRRVPYKKYGTVCGPVRECLERIREEL